MDRRVFLNRSLVAGTMASGVTSNVLANTSKSVKIVGVACSARKGKTTSTAVQIALDAAKSVNPRIKVELIDLGGKNISGWVGGASLSQAKEIMDDFQLIVPSFMAPDLGGVIIGSPVYLRSMSSVCKAFLERLMIPTDPELKLAGKPVGAVAVGGFRNGGQSRVIDQILIPMLNLQMMLVGGKPPAYEGATLWNAYNDDIKKDKFGVATAEKLGIRVAEIALELEKDI